MQNFIFYLGEIAAALLLIHTVLFLLEGRKPKWDIGPVATLLVISYYGLLHFRIITAAEIGIFALMLYSFFLNKPVSEKSQQIVIGLTILLVLILTFSKTPEISNVVECFAALFMIFGNYALNNKRKPLGWTLFVPSFFCTAYVVYIQVPSHYFFISVQVVLGIICFLGFMKRR